MSDFSHNLTKRRLHLGMTIEAVTEELNRRGVAVAFATVAGWFNANRGKRWKMDELKVLLDVLQTTFEEMSDGEIEIVDGTKAKVALARKIQGMSDEQAQAWLATIATMEKAK